MKPSITICLLLFLSATLRAQLADTTVRKVFVGFTYRDNIFPDSWQTAPVSASGHAIDNKEIRRSKKIIVKALNKYPETLLAVHLKYVYFLKDMKFYDVGFGGTNFTDAIYITNQGISLGYTDKYLEQTFHHEFSSILLRNKPSYLDTNEWKAANTPGFIYNDPENGVGAIRNNASSQALDSSLCEKGLLTQYAGSGIENDVNTIAQNLFSPEEKFWNYVDRFPRIKKKVNLLIRFYSRLDAIYTEAYFRKIDKPW